MAPNLVGRSRRQVYISLSFEHFVRHALPNPSQVSKNTSMFERSENLGNHQKKNRTPKTRSWKGWLFWFLGKLLIFPTMSATVADGYIGHISSNNMIWPNQMTQMLWKSTFDLCILNSCPRKSETWQHVGTEKGPNHQITRVMSSKTTQHLHISAQVWWFKHDLVTVVNICLCST